MKLLRLAILPNTSYTRLFKTRKFSADLWVDNVAFNVADFSSHHSCLFRSLEESYKIQKNSTFWWDVKRMIHLIWNIFFLQGISLSDSITLTSDIAENSEFFPSLSFYGSFN